MLFAGAALGAVFCLRESLPRLRQAADITTPDSVMVQTALWARRGGIIYHPASVPPYTPAVYGPLYYLALIALSYFTGPAFAPLLLAGRLFTFACFAALAVFLWFWARRLGLPRLLAVFAPGFLLSQLAFVHWNISTRPDLAALLAAIAALYAAGCSSRQLGDALSASGHPSPAVPPRHAPLHAADPIEAQPQRTRGPQGAAASLGVGPTGASRIGQLSRAPRAAGPPPHPSVRPARAGSGIRRRRPFAASLAPPILAGLLAATAVLLKQSTLAAPAAIALWFAARHCWRELAAFFATACAVVAAVLGALLLHGERLRDLALLQHPYASWSTGLGIALRQLARFAPDALILALALLGIAAAWHAVYPASAPPQITAASPGENRRAPAASAGWTLAMLYFFLAWVWGLLALCLNSGGGGNYLLAGWTATALLAAAGVAALRPIWPATPAAARALIILWACAAAAAGLVTWHHYAGRKIADLAPLAAVLVRRRVLTDVPYLGVHSQRPEYLDPYLLRTLELTHRWNSRHLVAQIQHRRFALILLDIGGGRANTRYRGLTRYDRPTVAAIRDAYQSYCVRGTVAVFLPASGPPPASLAAALRRAGCRPVLAPVRFFPATP